MIPQIDSQRAAELMREGHAYVDVRTVEEFRAGHADGAVNIPAFFRDPLGQMVPNPDFVRVMEASFRRDASLVIGCQAGRRSQMACEFLASVGYTRLHNIAGGFGGARDLFGRLSQPGWTQLGLPVSQVNGDGVSYESIRARALEEA
jgi:rhodanese-related sulfurtransferase